MYQLETYNSTLLKVGRHDNNFTIMFPYHPPKVFDGIIHGALCSYVLFGVVPVALCVHKHVYVLATGFSAGSTHSHKIGIDIIGISSSILECKRNSCLGCCKQKIIIINSNTSNNSILTRQDVTIAILLLSSRWNIIRVDNISGQFLK